jgi:hypothetical protein
MAEVILKLMDGEDMRDAFKKEGVQIAKQFTWEYVFSC